MEIQSNFCNLNFYYFFFLDNGNSIYKSSTVNRIEQTWCEGIADV